MNALLYLIKTLLCLIKTFHLIKILLHPIKTLLNAMETQSGLYPIRSLLSAVKIIFPLINRMKLNSIAVPHNSVIVLIHHTQLMSQAIILHRQFQGVSLISLVSFKRPVRCQENQKRLKLFYISWTVISHHQLLIALGRTHTHMHIHS